MNKKYNSFLLAFFLGISFFLSSCGPVTPFPTGTPTGTPTATRTPTKTPMPTPTKIPTGTPYARLQELGTLGKGILPQIVYSHDGQKAFLSDGYTLRVLNVRDDKEISSFEISNDGFTQILTTSPDDSLIIVRDGGSFRVIEINTWKEIARGLGYIAWAWATGPLFTPDGKYIVYRINTALQGRADSICLLDLYAQADNGLVDWCDNYPALEEDGDLMTDHAISPDGELVAAGYHGTGYGNILYIWDLKSRTILHEITGLPSRINSVAFSPDGSILATGSDDGLIRLWNPASGQIKRTIAGFVNDVVGVEFSPDGRQLIVNVPDQPAVSYGLSTEKQEALPPSPPDPLSTKMLQGEYMLSGGGSKIRFSPDGRTIAIGSSSIQIWDVRSQSLKVALFADHALSIAGMTYSPDGNHLAVVTTDGTVYVWNVRSGQQEFFVSADTLLDLQVFFASGTNSPGPGIGAGAYGEQSVDFSPDAGQIAFANGAGVEIWDIKNARRIRSLEHTQPVAFPSKVAFSTDGQFVYAALNRNRDLAVWNAKTGELVRQLDLPHVDPNAFTATAMQGQLFARNNYDEKEYWIEIWNIETGRMTRLPTHLREVEPLRFSTDGKFFAALLDHNQLYIWRTDTGQLTFVSDKIFNISDMDISPEGTLLATVFHGKATVWDLAGYANASFQPEFKPMPMPFTPTPWISSYRTNTPVLTHTPEPTQVVNPLPLLPPQAGMVNAQNSPGLRLMGRIGQGTVSQLTWSSTDGTIRVASSQGWYQLDPGQLEETSRFEHEQLWVTSGQVLPDGRSLAAGFTGEGRIQVWDVTNNKLVVDLDGWGEPAISPDGQWLVYKVVGKGLGTWNLDTGQPGLILRSSYDLASPVFSPDSQLVAAIQSDWSIRVWDLKTGLIVNGVGGSVAEITDMSFSPDGRYLLGAAGGSAWRWSMSPGYRPLEIELFEEKVHGRLKLFEAAVTSITSKSDNSVLAIGTSEKTIQLYNVQTGQVEGYLPGHGAAPVKMVFSPDGHQLISLDKDGQLILWDILRRKQIISTHEFGGPITGMTSRLDGNVSAWAQKSVWTFNPLTAELKRITYFPAWWILAASPAGDLVAGYTPLQVSLFDANTGELQQTLPEEAEDVFIEWYMEGEVIRQFYGALFSPDGKRLTTFGTGGAWMYAIPDGRLIGHLEGNNTRKAAFSPDGEWLVASRFEDIFSPWVVNFTSAKPVFSNFASGEPPGGVGEDYSQYAFSPDKRWLGLLRHSWNKPVMLEIVSTSTGAITRQLTFENTYLTSLAFNPSGTLIAIGRSDGRLMIVDFAALEVITILEGHIGPVTAILFSKDGRRLLSSGLDGTIKIWGVP